jgi:hypothetical protein
MAYPKNAQTVVATSAQNTALIGDAMAGPSPDVSIASFVGYNLHCAAEDVTRPLTMLPLSAKVSAKDRRWIAGEISERRCFGVSHAHRLAAGA